MQKDEDGAFDVKDAVRIAVDYLKGLGDFIPLAGLRLEETEYDDDEGEWYITLSTIDLPNPSSAPSPTDTIRIAAGLERGKRIYKVFQIDAGTGEVKSMKVRSLVPLE